MIAERVNMDGYDTSGAKVALLDRYHLWAFLVDPYNHQLRDKVMIQTEMAPLVNEMIEHYIPLDSDGSATSRDRVKEEFMVSSLHQTQQWFNHQFYLTMDLFVELSHTARQMGAYFLFPFA